MSQDRERRWSSMNRNRRSTRMRVHLQQQSQQECDPRGCSLSPGSRKNGGSAKDAAEATEKSEKISFISCARGFPSEDSAGDFAFSPPPLAPTFEPTEQEFAAGPLKYIASIRHLAEPFGICKIIPPPVSPASLIPSSRFR